MFLVLIPLCCVTSYANNLYFVKNITLNPNNTASLQRGAKIYFNYCSGCHSLSYERYSSVARLIGVTDSKKQIYTVLVQKTMLFSPNALLQQPINTSLNAEDAKKWFGVMPPDLTNITLVYSPGWVYNFLRGFYRDDTRVFGSNNLIVRNTAMPNVLLPLRGATEVVWINGKFDHFTTLHAGQLTPLAFDQAVFDLVNFLAVIAEPNSLLHKWLGGLVIIFLSFLLLIIYFLYQLTQKRKESFHGTT